MRSTPFIAALLLGAAPAFADAPTAAKPKPARGSPEEVVCHREEVTGSIARTRKTCMTRAQWTAQSDATQETAQRLNDRGSVNSCGATAPGGC